MGLFWVGKDEEEPPGLALGDGRLDDEPPPLGEGMPEDPPPPEDGGEGMDVPPGDGWVGAEGRQAATTNETAAAARPRTGRRIFSFGLAMVGTPQSFPPRLFSPHVRRDRATRVPSRRSGSRGRIPALQESPELLREAVAGGALDAGDQRHRHAQLKLPPESVWRVMPSTQTT